MRRFLLALLAIAVLSVASCENDQTTPDCIEVRLISQVCGNAVLQVINGYQALNLETWTDDNGIVHENTFSTFMDPCYENYPDNLEVPFYIAFADERGGTNCVFCLALPANMPQTYIDIRFIDPPCSTNDIN